MFFAADVARLEATAEIAKPAEKPRNTRQNGSESLRFCEFYVVRVN